MVICIKIDSAVKASKRKYKNGNESECTKVYKKKRVREKSGPSRSVNVEAREGRKRSVKERVAWGLIYEWQVRSRVSD